MVPTTAVSGVRCNLALMPRPWKSGLLRLPTTLQAMRRCCHACSTRLASMKSSLASVVMGPTTPRPAMTPSPYEAHRPLFRRAKTVKLGKTIDPGLRPAIAYSLPCPALAGKYGRSGPATIDAVSLKQKCAASNYSGNERWLAASTDRWPSCRFEPPSLIDLPAWARLRRWPCHKSVWGLGDYALAIRRIAAIPASIF